jgi:hypothetical protein
MLALDFGKLLGGGFPVVVANLVPGVGIDLVDRPLAVIRFLGAAVAGNIVFEPAAAG